MLFYLFCMFDDYGGTSHRNPESAGKSVVKTPYSQSSFSENDHRQVPIIPDDGGAKRGDPGGARGAHTTWWRGWTPRRTSRGCGCPGPPGSTPFRVLHPPVTLRHNTSSMESSAPLRGGNSRERKALRQGEICRGNSSLEEGDRSHRHRHQAGLHWDHHHHHLHRHLHRSTPFRCNN